MLKQKLFILWDENEGYDHRRIYLDEKSAQIGLAEHYTEFWIHGNKAKVEEIDAVSYFKDAL